VPQQVKVICHFAFDIHTKPWISISTSTTPDEQPHPVSSCSLHRNMSGQAWGLGYKGRTLRTCGLALLFLTLCLDWKKTIEPIIICDTTLDVERRYTTQHNSKLMPYSISDVLQALVLLLLW